MDPNNFISILTQIFTLVSIVLVFLTLREMKKQRIAEQKPDLLIPIMHVNGYGYYPNDGDHPLRAEHWTSRDDMGIEVDENEWHDQEWNHRVPLKLYNVGFGVAKNIKVIWNINFIRVVKQINDYCNQNSIPISVLLDKDQFKFRDGFPTWEMSANGWNRYYEFMMPISVVNEALSIALPFPLEKIISTIMYLRSHKVSNEQLKPSTKKEIDFPPTKLEIQYDDSADIHYSKRFDVVFDKNLILVGRPPEEDDAIKLIKLVKVFRGDFEFKSTKQRIF